MRRWRQLPAVLLIVIAGALEAQTASDKVTLTLDRARLIAREALSRGQPALALSIGAGLLEANPEDADALLLVSAAQDQLGNPAKGRRAAQLAYRAARSSDAKLQAATLAARHALAEERLTLTQLWLRRAAQHVPHEEGLDRIAEDYRRVRAANPLSFRLDLGLQPSSNVNNGADTAFLTVDGEDLARGTFSGAARALEGVIGEADLRLGYRLRTDARSATMLGGRFAVQQVRLSDESRAMLSPGLDDSDFNSTFAEVGVSHAFRIGGARPGHARITGALGASWYGGDLNYRFARIDAQRHWSTATAGDWSFGGTVIRRDAPGRAGFSNPDTVSYGLRGGYERALGNGDRVGFTLGVLETVSDMQNRNYSSVSLRASYGFGKQLGPVTVSTSLILALAEFDRYSTGFPVVTVTREDRSAYASLNLLFSDLDYAGFAPEITIRTGRRSSNVSRFDSSHLSVSLGVQSKF